MKENKRPTIAILMNDSHTQYSDELLNGFYSCAREEQVNLIILMRSGLPRHQNNILSHIVGDDYQIQFSSIYNYVSTVKPDALIIAYGSICILPEAPSKETLLSHIGSIPCLMIEDISEDPDIPSLVADNYAGMCECIRHLIIEHGYQKIAFLCGPENNRDSQERLRAYHDTMEEFGLPVTDTMVIHGNYTDLVDDRVEYLLDNNPGLEAIAFANDNMAKAGYRVCDARGLIVGKDLAITGFDDVDIAKTMNPPLTSISHNSFLFSYQALQNALQLCKGKKTQFTVMPSFFQKRNSCGCVPKALKAASGEGSREEAISYLHNNISQLAENLFSSISYEEEKKQYENLLITYFDCVVAAVFDSPRTYHSFDVMEPYLRQLCKHPHVSTLLMLEHIVKLLKGLMAYIKTEYSRSALLSIIASTQQHVHSHELLKLQSDLQTDSHRNWFVSLFTQDLMSTNKTLKQCLLCIMERLKLMQVNGMYFFLHQKPINYQQSDVIEPPAPLYLAAYSNDNEMISLPEKKWLPVMEEEGLASFLPQDKAYFYTSYVLFSGTEHYGILLCEHAPEDMRFLLACSLQIGAFLHSHRMHIVEQETKKELQTSLKRIQAQNDVLNFVSDYDELTGLLNRRGFMEKTIKTIEENAGKKAYLLFADLDHLKEINDCFGHADGDYAIRTAAEYLRFCLPEGSVIARIGGDEFVAFMVTDADHFKEDAMITLKHYANSFNQISELDYYIDLSAGIYPCVCDFSTPVSELLKNSDAILYEEKKKRKKSIKKNAPK